MSGHRQRESSAARQWRLRTVSLTALLSAATIALSALLVIAPTPPPVFAGVEDFAFDSFHADYVLGRDDGGNATLHTVETLVAQFPQVDQNRGIERAIPVVHGKVTLELSHISVTDAAGNPLEWERNNDGDLAVIRIGNANRFVHGQQTYVIEYSLRNVVQHFADTGVDEFYWDINGTGWAQPFGRVSMTLHLDDDIANSLTGASACYFGFDGGTDRCELAQSGSVLEASVDNLFAYQTMTVAIGFSPDTFIDPPILSEGWTFTVLPWLLLGVSGALWVLTLLFRAVVWRDHPGRGIIIPQYVATEDAYPALAAHLLGKKKTALPAQIIDFAVSRVILIRENLDQPSDDRWELELLVKPSELGPEEHTLLTHIFGTATRNNRVTLDPANRKLGDRLAKATRELEKRLVSRGWMEKPKHKFPTTVARITGWIAIGSIALFAFAFFADVDNALVWLVPWATFVLWIFTAEAAKPPYLINERGAAVRDYLLGIRDYVQLAEADRIRVLQAPRTAERIDVTDRQAVVKLYEKLLPYAVIFGIEREWLSELHKDYERLGQPDWSRGTLDLYSINTFSYSVSSARFAVTAPVSTSSGSSWSSSSGGSSGGGSSGGGGGGGGGGGW